MKEATEQIDGITIVFDVTKRLLEASLIPSANPSDFCRAHCALPSASIRGERSAGDRFVDDNTISPDIIGRARGNGHDAGRNGLLAH